MSEYRMTIRGIDATVADELRAHASTHDLTLGECVTEAVAAWLDQQDDDAGLDKSFDAIQERLNAQRALLQQFSERIGVAA